MEALRIDSTFPVREHLIRIERLSTTCAKCDITYRTLEVLRNHVRTSHDEMDDKITEYARRMHDVLKDDTFAQTLISHSAAEMQYMKGITVIRASGSANVLVCKADYNTLGVLETDEFVVACGEKIEQGVRMTDEVGTQIVCHIIQNHRVWSTVTETHHATRLSYILGYILVHHTDMSSPDIPEVWKDVAKLSILC